MKGVPAIAIICCRVARNIAVYVPGIEVAAILVRYVRVGDSVHEGLVAHPCLSSTPVDGVRIVDMRMEILPPLEQLGSFDCR